MVESLDITKEAFARAKSFEDLAGFLIPFLKEQFGENRVGDIRAFLTLYHLTFLRKRVFSFEEYRIQTRVEDGENLLPEKKVRSMLNATMDIGIIYSDKKSRYFIRRKFYGKLSRLAEIYEQQELAKLLAI